MVSVSLGRLALFSLAVEFNSRWCSKSKVCEVSVCCSQFALLLLHWSVQAWDEFEETSAEAFGFWLPLQRVETSLLLPRGGRRRRCSPHVAACAGAAGQLRLGRREELAGRSETLLLLLRLLFVFVCVGVVHIVHAAVLVHAGLVERVILSGCAEEAGAAAGAAGAAKGSLSGGAGSAEAAVHAC